MCTSTSKPTGSAHCFLEIVDKCKVARNIRRKNELGNPLAFADVLVVLAKVVEAYDDGPGVVGIDHARLDVQHFLSRDAALWGDASVRSFGTLDGNPRVHFHELSGLDDKFLDRKKFKPRRLVCGIVRLFGNARVKCNQRGLSGLRWLGR